MQNNVLLNTNSDLPSVLSKETHKLLSTIHLTSDEILKVIKNLDPNKAHGHDMIMTRHLLENILSQEFARFFREASCFREIEMFCFQEIMLPLKYIIQTIAFSKD